MNKEYKCKDLYLICFLEIKGFNALRMEKVDRICFFYFEETESLKDTIKDFFNNGKVNVLDFKNKLRDKKSEISSY